jgi:hypothetical protein
LLQLRLREAPVDVDHLHAVAHDRCGYRQGGAFRAIAGTAVIEVDAQNSCNAGEVDVLEHLGGQLLAFVVE